MIQRTAAYTAVEVLVSLALGLVVVGLCTTAFSQTVKTVRRTQVRLAMHETANTAYTCLSEDLGAALGTTAFFVESTADSGAGDGRLDLVFMRGQLDPLEFTTHLDSGRYEKRVSDEVWVLWRYDQRTRTLSRGVNDAFREFRLDQDWRPGGSRNYRDRRFAILPQPQRIAITDARTTLDANAFGTGHRADVGDFTDLEQRLIPVLRGVTACDAEILFIDGTTEAADLTASTVIARSGSAIDGGLRGSTPAARSRPALVRLRFTLGDPRRGIEQAFSFSVPITDLQPWTEEP